MAYAVIHHFPGGTKANYEASLAAVHPGPNQLPQGQIAHVAGADGTLLPKLTAGVDGGFPTPPEETAIDVYKVLP
jgi:hypothetical protein